MAKGEDGADEFSVLRSKQNAMRFETPVRIAGRLPMASQQGDIRRNRHHGTVRERSHPRFGRTGTCRQHGRSRYEVTK